MRPFRPRIRLRTMLVLVVIAGLLSWAGVRIVPWARQMWAVSAEHGSTADFLASNQRLDLRFADGLDEQARKTLEAAPSDDPAAKEKAERERREAEFYRREMRPYHAELERIYRRGASRPWEPLRPFPDAPTFR